MIHCYGAAMNCHGTLLHLQGTMVHIHSTGRHFYGTVVHMHGTVVFYHSVEYINGCVLQSNIIYIVVVLFHIPNSDSTVVYCYSGAIDLHGTVLHFQGTISGSVVTAP